MYNIFDNLQRKRNMSITVILFFSLSVSLCLRTSCISPKLLAFFYLFFFVVVVFVCLCVCVCMCFCYYCLINTTSKLSLVGCLFF